jgi:UDP-N-acetyl-D-galactosamine dehydrogenase
MLDKICILGGGYVGLPLAVALSEYYSVIVLTKTDAHAQELYGGIDRTKSFSSDELKRNSIVFTSAISDASDATVFIVTVPTPIYADYTPDLSPVEEATKSIASVLKKEDIVIYESTVYIGCTEEFCVPILEAESALVFNKDFYCGFSPERINPADTERTIHTVMKIIAGSTPQVTEVMKEMYGKIVHAGYMLLQLLKLQKPPSCLRIFNEMLILH